MLIINRSIEYGTEITDKVISGSQGENTEKIADFIEMRNIVKKWHYERVALMVHVPASPVVTAFGVFLGGGIIYMVLENPLYLLGSLICGLLAGAIMSSEHERIFKEAMEKLDKDKELVEKYEKALYEEEVRQIRMKNSEGISPEPVRTDMVSNINHLRVTK